MKLFGTDGIRGPINASPLLPADFARLGLILGLIAKNQNQHANVPTTITIGRDTRASGFYLLQALVSGISAAGVACRLVGVVPTAALAVDAKLAKSYFGVMISASHNAYYDNGLKLFGPDGFKISASLEALIEEYFFSAHDLAYAIASMPGAINDESPNLAHYEELFSSFVQSSKPLRVVIDCAHGAASYCAPMLFAKLGLDIHFIGCAPDGHNINRDFGSEAPFRLLSEMKNYKADLGFAFDGDADRIIVANEKAELIDGDAILALCALYLKEKNMLANNTLVATVMSSTALDQALLVHNIKVLRTPVGDKHIASCLKEHNLSFGGENSGHLILAPYATTGDALVSALTILEIVIESKKTLSDLISFYKPTPKILKNIDISQKIPLHKLPKTQEALAHAHERLGARGRVLIRYSGTENKVRILVESASLSECNDIADNIADEIYNEISQKLIA
jgi:phosphoglucosamine mutase